MKVIISGTTGRVGLGVLLECLALGVPAVASDCVERPQGTVLFRTRDLDDFEVAVRKALTVAGSSNTHSPHRALSDADRERIERYLDLLTSFAQPAESSQTATT